MNTNDMNGNASNSWLGLDWQLSLSSGWGIAGFCPGAAIPALGTGRWEVALFLVCVAIGFYIRRLVAPTQMARAAS